MKIVAMGGGERTKAFDTTLELTGHEDVTALIVPTACSTERSYSSKVPLTVDRFRDLGVKTSVLHEFGQSPSQERIAHELGRASLIYTIGGNTPHLLNQLHAFGGFDPIREAVLSGTLHAGTSAGALLPFEIAHSNIAKKPAEEEWDYAFLPTLGVVPGVATAHANQHDPTPAGRRQDTRLEALVSAFPQNMSVGYAIDNGASLVITDDAVGSINETTGSRVHLLSRKNDSSISVEPLKPAP